MNLKAFENVLLKLCLDAFWQQQKKRPWRWILGVPWLDKYTDDCLKHIDILHVWFLLSKINQLFRNDVKASFLGINYLLVLESAYVWALWIIIVINLGHLFQTYWVDNLFFDEFTNTIIEHTFVELGQLHHALDVVLN